MPWKIGRYRNCLKCNSLFYTSDFQVRYRPHRLCPKCSKIYLAEIRKPVWIQGRRRSPYSNCPICGATLLFCSHRDTVLENRPAKK